MPLQQNRQQQQTQQPQSQKQQQQQRQEPAAVKQSPGGHQDADSLSPKFKEQQLLHQQMRTQRIQQKLANYHSRPRPPKREPPMVPSPSFASAVALTIAAFLLIIGGGVCLAKQCNSDSSVGVALLVLAGLLVAVSVVLFASLPCCYCNKSRNCQVRASCTERLRRMRETGRRRQARIGSLSGGSNGGGVMIVGPPVITIKDYSTTNSRTTSNSTSHQSPSTESSGDGGGSVESSGRRMSAPALDLESAWSAQPIDPRLLHPMYGRRSSLGQPGW